MSYDSNSIKVLSDIEHIKLRKEMYIGDAQDPRHLFSEILDNALDECQCGYSDRVIVKVDTKENKYTVTDFGRGIPHGTKTLEDGSKVDILEVLCTKSNSGGKFDKGAYLVSSGLHGLGMTCTNALSKYFSIKSIRENKVERIVCEYGKKAFIESNGWDDSHGTTVEFIPDESCFPSGVIPIDFIVNRCRIASSFGMLTELYVDGNKVDTNSTIFDMIEQDDEVSTYGQTEFKVIDEDTSEFVKIALRYTSDTSWYYRGFTNLLPNQSGGTHYRMFDDAVVMAWRKYDLPELLDKDFFVGIKAVIAVFLSETSFSSQTKEKLTVDKKYLARFVPMIADKIYEWLENNPEVRDGLIKRFREHRAYINKSVSQKEIQQLIYKNTSTNGKSIRRKSVVDKLKECTSKDRENTELIICEGDSAAGSLVQARDIRTQAILPLRGKILNVTKLDDIYTCMKNEEIKSIVNSIGAGLFDDCDPSISRYERIIILTDADPDGLNISALVIGLFVNVLPEIVKAGMLYVAEPALYGWKDKEGYHFTDNIKAIPKGVSFTRYKGLGEMDPEELQYSILDPQYRKLMRVEYPEDLSAMNSVLTSSKVKFNMLKDMGVIKYVPYDISII